MSDIHYDTSRIGGGYGGYGGDGCGFGGGGGILGGLILGSLIGRGGFGGFGGHHGGHHDHGCGCGGCCANSTTAAVDFAALDKSICDGRVDSVRSEAAILSAIAAGDSNLAAQICDVRASEAETRNLITNTALHQQIALNAEFTDIKNQIGAGNQSILDAIKQTEIDSLRDRLAAAECGRRDDAVIAQVQAVQQQTQIMINNSNNQNTQMFHHLASLVEQNLRASNKTMVVGTGNVATPTNTASTNNQL